MTAEEFYKIKDYPNYDKFDKKVPKFDYYDMLDFAEAYHKERVEAISDEDIENQAESVDRLCAHTLGIRQGANWFKNKLLNK